MLFTGYKYNFLEKDNCIPFSAVGFNRAYRSELMIEEDVNNKTSITHQAFVKVMEVISPDVYLVSVVEWNFRINNRRPDLLLEQLAEKCRRPLENLMLYVSVRWQVIGIQNHTEIMNKWYALKEQLQREYAGEIAEKYINLNEQVLLKPEVLLSKLKKDVFLSQYFVPLYSNPFNNLTIRTRETVNFMGLGYEPDMFYAITESNAESTVIEKEIDADRYNHTYIPVEVYYAKYRLDAGFGIEAIEGKFQNYGRKCSFSITPDNDLAAELK